jgi:CTP:molybdopterin cytidylyltransferase MocA
MSGSFSILTLSKDDPAGLERTLASISRQTLAPREVILVRAGRSKEVAVPTGVIDIPDPGNGISAAFNAAIDASHGERLVFLNGGDAFSEPASLNRLEEACLDAANADIVACRARTDTGDRIPWRVPRSFCDFLFISHQASAFRRALFEDVGRYSPAFRVRMDLDWMARYLLARGMEGIAFSDRVIVDYTLDGLSSTSLAGFYGEEFRVLTRDAKFLPALLGLLARRLPERIVRESWRRLTGGG